MPIKDNRSFQRLEQELQQLETVAGVRELIRLLGKPGARAAEALDQLPELARSTRKYIESADAFNAHYRERDWIAHEYINHDLMVKVTELALAGDIDEGERLLVESVTHDFVRLSLVRLNRLKPFGQRERLLMLALDDHCAGRYHASIPVVLAQLDGICTDLMKRKLYVSNPKQLQHLIVGDSIAGHMEGAAQVIARWSRARTVTSEQPTDTPYRHGILHGRELAYDNQKASAKCFAMVVAIGCIAIRLDELQRESLVLVTQPAKTQVTWIDVVTAIRDRHSGRKQTRPPFPQDMPLNRTSPSSGQAINGDSKFLVGLPSRPLAEHLLDLGFEGQTPTRWHDTVFWTFRWKSSEADYTVELTGSDPAHIERLRGTVFPFSSDPVLSFTREFFCWLVTVPFAGSNASVLRAWIQSLGTSETELIHDTIRYRYAVHDAYGTMSIQPESRPVD